MPNTTLVTTHSEQFAVANMSKVPEDVLKHFAGAVFFDAIKDYKVRETLYQAPLPSVSVSRVVVMPKIKRINIDFNGYFVSVLDTLTLLERHLCEFKERTNYPARCLYLTEFAIAKLALQDHVKTKDFNFVFGVPVKTSPFRINLISV